jgi:hypothetical protein
LQFEVDGRSKIPGGYALPSTGHGARRARPSVKSRTECCSVAQCSSSHGNIWRQAAEMSDGSTPPPAATTFLEHPLSPTASLHRRAARRHAYRKRYFLNFQEIRIRTARRGGYPDPCKAVPKGLRSRLGPFVIAGRRLVGA